jgi:hypothetical protein
MGVIAPNLEEGTCDRCGGVAHRAFETEDRFVCVLCRKLGDRSLVWFMRAYKEADNKRVIIDRFRAAKGRSWMYDDITNYLSRRGSMDLPPKLPPGIRQWAKEKEEGRLPLP